MKRIFFLICPILVFSLASCDKVDRPVIVKSTAVGSKFVTKTNKGANNYRKVFLEDYTGQRCPNCPDASSIIKNSLLPRYKDTLVVLAIHAGDLSTPFGAMFRNQDFRTTPGTTWHNNYAISTWPKGLINRKNYGSGLTLERTTWASAVPQGKADAYIVKLDVTTSYDTTVRALNTDIAVFFKKPYANATKVIIAYYEDKIVGKQDSSGIDLEEYEFEHMLRGTITDTWGSDLTTSASATNDSAKVSFPNFALPTTINAGKGLPVNDRNVSVLVLVYDATNKEILQVEKVKIR